MSASADVVLRFLQDGCMTTYEAVARALADLEQAVVPPSFLPTLLAPINMWTTQQVTALQTTRPPHIRRCQVMLIECESGHECSSG
jgi:hypothetical protein